MSNYNYKLQKNPKCRRKKGGATVKHCDVTKMKVRITHGAITLGAMR